MIASYATHIIPCSESFSFLSRRSCVFPKKRNREEHAEGTLLETVETRNPKRRLLIRVPLAF